MQIKFALVLMGRAQYINDDTDYTFNQNDFKCSLSQGKFNQFKGNSKPWRCSLSYPYEHTPKTLDWTGSRQQSPEEVEVHDAGEGY